ncbi:hypothetical protein C2E23DRAFT_801384 [Lenzites betulinus]|nr:hypothetical protein C2E23DRAFT_801384 [Lenzites betulinus]
MASRLELLNDDVFLQILDLLIHDSLNSLSTTSKTIRSACLPVLFSSSRVFAANLVWDHFIAPHFWPYVQHLTFVGAWMEFNPNAVDPNLPPVPLSSVLLKMPRLSGISIQRTKHRGVPREALDAIFSLPRLREFEITESLHHWDVVKYPSAKLSFPIPPLVVYRQLHIKMYRDHPRARAGDGRLLLYLSEHQQFQQSLEILAASTEIMPFAAFAPAQWPKLREITLQGEAPPQSLPLARVFGGVPELRQLHLELACTTWFGRTMLAYPGWKGPMPWPQLQHLVVSWPHQEDPLYSHLPRSLRRLVLRCWPRRYLWILMPDRGELADLGWYHDILTAADMIQLLSRCNVPELEELEVEYEEDEHDTDLLQLIASAFPNLVTLTIFRYRRRSSSDPPLDEIAKALSPLVRLRTLYLHLDLTIPPHPYGEYHPGGREASIQLFATMNEMATIFAQELGPSLDTLCFLKRWRHMNLWVPFRIERPENMVPTAHYLGYGKDPDIKQDDDLGIPVFFRDPTMCLMETDEIR